MIEFQCDYAEGAHPKILERLVETNMDQTPGYGLDPYCDEARRFIRKACGREDIDVQLKTIKQAGIVPEDQYN